MKKRDVITVTELVSYLHKTIEKDEFLSKVWLEGEISNFTKNSQSKHMYFTLKDFGGKIKVAMFAINNRRLRFIPKDGDKVLVKGEVSFYEKEGYIQLYAKDMRLNGTGDLFSDFETLKSKLALEGIFSKQKKEVPYLPKRIGIVTSPTGAAVRDIIVTIKRRLPSANILLFPVSVQGLNSSYEVSNAIEKLNSSGLVDVIIIGRGGGSIEELWSFNEEIVARSIYESSVPIISAVGHETDVTISDFAADIRAATPTAAGELVVPTQDELQNRIDNLYKRLIFSEKNVVKKHEDKIERLNDKLIKYHPETRFRNYKDKIDKLNVRIQYAFKLYITNRKNNLRELILRLDSASPLKILSRGYALVEKNNYIVKSINDININDHIDITLKDGTLSCQIKSIGVVTKDV